MSMDAVEFIEEHRRMCKTYSGCDGCPAYNDGLCKFSAINGGRADEQIALLEEWASAHPRKTRQSEFLKMFPNVRLNSEGLIDILPCRMDPKNYPVDINKGGCKDAPCIICMEKFWNQEVE